ncbi:hypothetical protein J437_LFUL012559 [Ladona fulva]|uniref:Uncharacterized protein n=1 Tax=Ladona fulva TaxID=123851 RepID=A0A8K0KT03_LADFU|nr:hypothetical protein J437_LFUL012559 [Ladona fulva]
MSPAEGIASGRIKYCMMKDGHLILKNSGLIHDYTYQIQGQLHITRRKFCISALWSPKGTLTQTIEKDGSFWNNSMEIIRDPRKIYWEFYSEKITLQEARSGGGGDEISAKIT